MTITTHTGRQHKPHSFSPRNFIVFVICLFALFAISLNGHGQLLQWNTFGNLGTETTEPSVYNDVNVLATNLTQGSITAAANANRFGGSAWCITNLAAAVTGNDYIQFIVTPNSGYSFTPTSFAFQWDKSGTGPTTVTLRSSADGYTADLGTVVCAAIGTVNTITISGLSALTTATTFRLYGYGATAAGGTGGFDVASSVVNVQLNGTTASTGGTPTISTTGTLGAVNTTYGTASASPTTFSVSGANMLAGILVTPPTGYEVCLTVGGSYTSTVTVGAAGTIASTPVYVRLKATATVAGSPYSGNIACTSASATTVNVATASSTVSAKALTVTSDNISKVYGTALSSGAGKTTFTSSGLANSETIGSVTLTYGTGAAATAAVGVNAGTSVPTLATGGTFTASNYTITYVAGSITVTAKALTVTSDDISKVFGATLTSGAGKTTFTSTGLANSETIGSVTLTYGTGAAAGDAVGTYSGQSVPTLATGGTFTSSNYTITYVAGSIIVTSAATPTISTTGALSAVNTTYGTASASPTTFSVSGTNMTAGILVTPPAGYEVCLTVGGSYTSTVTVGAAGTIVSTPVYIRLAATTAVGSYSGNIACSSSGATTVYVATVSSTVSAKALTVTSDNISKVYGTTLTSGAGKTTFTSSGLANSETIGSVTLTYGTGAAATAAVGVNAGTSVPTLATGGTFTASNYTITYVAGSITVTAKALTVTSDDISKVFGATLTSGAGKTTFTSSGLANSETIGSVTLTFGTGAAAGDAVGTYAGQSVPTLATGGTFTASNYTITYVAGSIIVTSASSFCLSENFVGFTAGTHASPDAADVSGSLNTYTQTTGWTGSKVYQAGGETKLGSTSAAGSIITPTVALSTGASISFDLQKYGSDAAVVQVFHAPDGTTFAQVGSDITAPATYTTQTLNITGGTASSKIKIVAKNAASCRFYLDNIAVTCSASCSAPTTPAYNISFSSIYATTMTVGWTNGDGAKRVVIMNTANTFTTPSDGTDPTANPVYGGSGQQVVYNGSGSSAGISGLTASTTYWFRVYEYNCTGTNTLFLSSTGTNNPNSQITNAATSNVSDIISAGQEKTNILYASYQEANLTSSSLEVARFTIRDGGGTADGDALGTKLTSVTFSVQNSAYIQRIALYDGTTEISEIAPSPSITFSSLTLTAADGGMKDFSIRVSFANSVIDNAQIKFTITAASADGTGSIFAASDAGGAFSSTTGDNNKIEVVASLLRFTQQPTTTAINASMTPAVTVAASDAYNNNDQDYSGSVSITSTGTLSGSPVTATLSSGIATYSTLTHTAAGTGYILTAALSPLTSANSSAFAITSFAYLSGDYRTTATGASFASTTGWETYNGSTWSAASVAIETTSPSRIIVLHTGTSAGTNGTHSYNDITIMSGGELNVSDATNYTTGTYFISAGKTLEIQYGGILRQTGYMNLSSSANFIIRDGGYYYINNATFNNVINTKYGCHWNGDENFEDNSTVVVQQWDNVPAGSTTRSFLNPTYQISANHSGNGFLIGNLTYDYTPPTQNQTILPALGAHLLFCNNLTIINHSNTYSIAITANQLQSPILTIRGNLTVKSGLVSFGTNYTSGAYQKITVRGNLDIQNTDATYPTVVYLHTLIYPATDVLTHMWFYLEGNLSVANGASLTTGATASSTTNTMFYFLGINAQTVSGTGTINLANVTISKGTNEVTFVDRGLAVSDSLNFLGGKFVLGNYDLSNGASGKFGTQAGGSSSSYAVTNGTGVYKRFNLPLSTNHIFPVGPTISSYNPATLNYTGTIDDFSAKVEVGLNPTTGTDPFFVNRTWDIHETNSGGTTASLTLQWEAAHENASFMRNSSKIFHYGSSWVAQTSSALGGGNPYTKTAAGLTSFSPHAVGTDPIDLPVELIYFDAKQKGSAVEIAWSTASEVNNDYFVIERSKDGFAFADIDIIQGAGNSNMVLNYSATDDSPLNGVSYYRLKQVDFDGAYSYSGIVAVNFGSSSTIGYSNFISNSEQISFYVNNSDLTSFRVQIIDITGRIMYSDEYKELSENVSVEIPSSGFVPGIYCLVLSNNSKFTTNKFTVK